MLGLGHLLNWMLFLLLTLFTSCNKGHRDALTIDLYHKFDLSHDFKLRGSILVKPSGLATFIKQLPIDDRDLINLRKSENYYLKASLKGEPSRETKTVIKSCSLIASNFADVVAINLNALNEYISINVYTNNPECIGEAPEVLSTNFNTTLIVESGVTGPQPDTATYIKRLEQERQNKLKEGKEDNRSFFAKYWFYIVPAVIFLMMVGGPEQGAGR